MALGSAETGARTLQGVAATPGWNVIDEFLYTAAENAAPRGTLTRKLRAVAIATTAALSVRVRLVRADTLVAVAGSTLTFAAPVVAEAAQETVDLTSALVNGVIYQLQAEVTGGGAGTDFGTISASVNAIYSY
jgi:hypothetical protein